MEITSEMIELVAKILCRRWICLRDPESADLFSEVAAEILGEVLQSLR